MSKGLFDEYSCSWIQSKCSTHTHEYRASVYSYSTHITRVLWRAAGAPLASRASHTLAIAIPLALARLSRRAPLVHIPPREAQRAQRARLLLLLQLLERERSRSRRGSRRSALGSQLAAPPSLARSQSVLASAVASDSTSSSSSWDWPALRYLRKYRSRMVCLLAAC